MSQENGIFLMRYVNMDESHKGPLHAVTLPLEKENRLAPPALGVQGGLPGQQQRTGRNEGLEIGRRSRASPLCVRNLEI